MSSIHCAVVSKIKIKRKKKRYTFVVPATRTTKNDFEYKSISGWHQLINIMILLMVSG
jgi:hypothetical protein